MTELNTVEKIVEVQEDAKIDVTYKEVKDPYGFIYITTNLVNGKRYLGQGTFKKYWQKYLGSGIAFKNALKNYRRENFCRNIIYICYSQEELNQVEYDLSVFFNVVESDDWYNLVLGGGTSRGWHPSAETKRKISEKTKERLSDSTNHPMYGKHHLVGEKNPMFGVSPKERMDEETYQQWYDKHKQYWENPSNKGKHIWEDKQHPNLGKQLSDSTKEKISLSAKQRFANPENHPMYGRSQSDKAKKAVGDAHRGYKNWNSQMVYSLELDMLFWGATEAAQQLNCDGSGISKCCKGKRKSCGKHPITGESLHWIYVNDLIQQDGAFIPGAITLGYVTSEQVNNYLNSLKEGNDK